MTRYNKTIAALVGALVVAATEGLLPGELTRWVPVVVAFATALGVYAVPNRPPAGHLADSNVSETDH